MGKKYFLSFQTVFRLNENARWLEEFLIYYIHIGFDHFYLYDGSIDEYDPIKKVNKNGDPILLNEPEEDKVILQDIMKNMVTKLLIQNGNQEIKIIILFMHKTGQQWILLNGMHMKQNGLQ